MYHSRTMWQRILLLMIGSFECNRLFFLEPMESSSTQTYLQWSKDYMMRLSMVMAASMQWRDKS